MPKTIIVDENDKIIGTKESKELQSSDIYRVSALWIQNSRDEILLAQRSFNKNNDPGKWGPAVAGTIEEGETYETNIIKEAEEEIGLKDFDFKKSFNRKNNGEHKHFTQWFFAKIDKEIKDFKIQKEEVEQIKWFKKDELLKELTDNPDKFLKSIKDCVEYYS